jgi:hypothetical protein
LSDYLIAYQTIHMCVLHVNSKNRSFKLFLEENPGLPAYQSHEKGELPNIGKEDVVYEDYGFSCEVSDRAWNDVEGQIVDIISFLEVYTPYLTTLKETHEIDDWRFDLPYECGLDETHFTQCNFLPPKLMRLAGTLEIGVELSLYWPNSEEDAVAEYLTDIDASAGADTDDE